MQRWDPEWETVAGAGSAGARVAHRDGHPVGRGRHWSLHPRSPSRSLLWRELVFREGLMRPLGLARI